MNRIDRLTSIILMLQSHRVLTAEKVAAHFEISVRTVYRDFAALGEAGVPIMAEAGVGYSLVRGYNVPPIMFTEAEAAALFMSGAIADKFGDDSLKQSLNGALLKVRAVLPDGHNTYLNQLDSRLEIWERQQGSSDQQSLIPVQEAIVRKRCIQICYNAGGRGELTERTVEPLGLMFYSRQWHLIAWCQLRKDIRDFRLDRVTRWKILETTFTGHADFSLEHYLQDIDEEPALIPVQLECERWVYERMQHEKPCQVLSTQELPEGRLLVEANAYSLVWLALWVIGAGGAALARKPPELRKRVAEGAAKIMEQHR